ncbi:MAG: GntR family transcriptional regulator [Zoogloeaceae bacterium]|nr:GntR family transcriptional regulator [Zoogloeaceae bacterium]
MRDSRPIPTGNPVHDVYEGLKEEIFGFRLLPGDRFRESQVAERFAAPRPAVKDALRRLEREGFLHAHPRAGWALRPFDFDRFEQLYELRLLLELAAVQRLCDAPLGVDLTPLTQIWLVPAEERVMDGRQMAALDEAFHQALVRASGNAEMATVHEEVQAKIRILRRLDFCSPARIHTAYDEHGELLRLLLQRKAPQAAILLRGHVDTSMAEVRKLALHKLASARREQAHNA